MRKNSFISVFAVLLVAAALALPNGAAAAGLEGQNTVTVTGHAETTVVPDLAVITAGVVTIGDNVESARDGNNKAMSRIIDALVDRGIDRAKITTSQFVLEPIYHNEAKSGPIDKIKGYRLQNSVTIAVEDMKKIGDVVDTAFKAGANQFQGLKFGLKNDGALRDELLKKAVQDGHRKATIIAQALGTDIRNPVAVTESGHFYAGNEFNRALKASAAGTPIEAGTITLAVDVNVVYALSQF